MASDFRPYPLRLASTLAAAACASSSEVIPPEPGNSLPVTIQIPEHRELGAEGLPSPPSSVVAGTGAQVGTTRPERPSPAASSRSRRGRWSLDHGGISTAMGVYGCSTLTPEWRLNRNTLLDPATGKPIVHRAPRVVELQHDVNGGCVQRSIEYLTGGAWSPAQLGRALGHLLAKEYAATAPDEDFAGATWFLQTRARDLPTGPPDTWPVSAGVATDRANYPRAARDPLWPASPTCMSAISSILGCEIYLHEADRIDPLSATYRYHPAPLPAGFARKYGPRYKPGSRLHLEISWNSRGAHVEPLIYPKTATPFCTSDFWQHERLGMVKVVSGREAQVLSAHANAEAALAAANRGVPRKQRINKNSLVYRNAKKTAHASGTSLSPPRAKTTRSVQPKKKSGGPKRSPGKSVASQIVAEQAKAQGMIDAAKEIVAEGKTAETWEELADVDGVSMDSSGNALTIGARQGNRVKNGKEDTSAFPLFPWEHTKRALAYLQRAYPGVHFGEPRGGEAIHGHKILAYDRRVNAYLLKQSLTKWVKAGFIFEPGGTVTRRICTEGHICSPILYGEDFTRHAVPNANSLEVQRDSKLTMCNFPAQRCRSLLEYGTRRLTGLHLGGPRPTSVPLQEIEGWPLDVDDVTWLKGQRSSDKIASRFLQQFPDKVGGSFGFLCGVAESNTLDSYPAKIAVEYMWESATEGTPFDTTPLLALAYDATTPRTITSGSMQWDSLKDGCRSLIGGMHYHPPVAAQMSRQGLVSCGYGLGDHFARRDRIASGDSGPAYSIALMNIFDLMSGPGVLVMAWHARLGVPVYAATQDYTGEPKYFPRSVEMADGSRLLPADAPEATCTYHTGADGRRYVTQDTIGNNGQYRDPLYLADTPFPLGCEDGAVWRRQNSTPNGQVVRLNYLANRVVHGLGPGIPPGGGGPTGGRRGRHFRAGFPSPMPDLDGTDLELPAGIIGADMRDGWWDVASHPNVVNTTDRRPLYQQSGSVPGESPKVFIHDQQGMKIVDGDGVPLLIDSGVFYDLAQLAALRPRDKDGYEAFVQRAKNSLARIGNLSSREQLAITTHVFPLAFVWGAAKEAEATNAAFVGAQTALINQMAVKSAGTAGTTLVKHRWWHILHPWRAVGFSFTTALAYWARQGPLGDAFRFLIPYLGINILSDYSKRSWGKVRVLQYLLGGLLPLAGFMLGRWLTRKRDNRLPVPPENFVIPGLCVKHCDVSRPELRNQVASLSELKRVAATDQYDIPGPVVYTEPQGIESMDCEGTNNACLLRNGPIVDTQPTCVGKCICNKRYCLRFRTAISHGQPTQQGIALVADWVGRWKAGSVPGYPPPRPVDVMSVNEWLDKTRSPNIKLLRRAAFLISWGWPVNYLLKCFTKLEQYNRCELSGHEDVDWGKWPRPRNIISPDPTVQVKAGRFVMSMIPSLAASLPDYAAHKTKTEISAEISRAIVLYRDPSGLSGDCKAMDASHTPVLHRHVINPMYEGPLPKIPDNVDFWECIEERKVSVIKMPTEIGPITLAVANKNLSGYPDTTPVNTSPICAALGVVRELTGLRFHAWVCGDDVLIIAESVDMAAIFQSFIQVMNGLGFNVSESYISPISEAEFCSCRIFNFGSQGYKLVRKPGRVLERAGWTYQFTLAEAVRFCNGDPSIRRMARSLARSKALSDWADCMGVPVLHHFCAMRERLTRGAKSRWYRDLARQLYSTLGFVPDRASLDQVLEGVVRRAMATPITDEARAGFEEVTGLTPTEQRQLEGYYGSITLEFAKLNHPLQRRLLRDA